ncbi:MAG: DUF992 domain-containing protein [Hyphomicrobiales bacterium]|nr:DUF992 domain-containing protein [Hyphomicrobiales bacterium]
MLRSSAIGLALAGALGLIATGASAQSVHVGVLECRGIGTTGFIIGSVQDIECVFRTSYMPPVRYHGVVRKWGLDVGVTEASVLAWGVLAPTDRIGPGDLAGTYTGVSAGAAVVVGAGANALVGGSGNTFALQPVSVEGQTGINVTLGVASLELRYGP